MKDPWSKREVPSEMKGFRGRKGWGKVMEGQKSLFFFGRLKLLEDSAMRWAESTEG